MADLVLFNISSVEESEEVRLGQLHLNRRKLHQRHFSRRVLAPPYRVRVYRVSGNRLSSLGSIPVPQMIKAAWHAVDITAPLRELLLNPHNSYLLGIRFEAPRGKPLTPKHFLRDTSGSSASFLIIFSDENTENDITDEGEILKKAPPVHTHELALKIQSATKGKWTDESNDLRSIFPDISSADYTSMDKIGVNNNSSTSVPDSSTQEVLTTNLPEINKKSNESRQKRSVEDNELPGFDSDSPNLILAKEHSIPLPTRRRKGRRGGNSGKRKNKKNRYGNEPWNAIPLVS